MREPLSSFFFFLFFFLFTLSPCIVGVVVFGLLCCGVELLRAWLDGIILFDVDVDGWA